MAINLGPPDTKFTLLDRSTAGSQWSTALSQTVDGMLRPAGFRCRLSRLAKDWEPLCAELIEELQQRRQMREEDSNRQPTHIVLLTEADTIEYVRRVPGQFGMGDGPGSKMLSRLLAEGPSVGIHFLLSFARLSQVRQVLDSRSQLPYVSHRVALQMAEVDSHDLIGDRSANRLQTDSPTPICAVYRDFQAGTPPVRFKPYSTEPQGENPADSLLGQIGLVADCLKKR